jgi:AraC family transcriptional regulator
MVLARKPAGSFQDAQSPDLVLIQCFSHQVRQTANFGDGRMPQCVRKGDIIVVPPTRATAFDVSDPHLIRVTTLHVPDLGKELSAGDSPIFGSICHQPIRNTMVWTLCERLWDACRLEAPVGRLLVEGAAMTIVAELLAHESLKKSPPAGGLARWQIRKVCDLMLSDLSQTVGLRDLGSAVGLSQFHFCRAFQRSMNVTPHGWLRERRMERAREILRTHPEWRLDAVAAAVGYSGVSTFGAAFRKAIGVSPSVWRQTAG